MKEYVKQVSTEYFSYKSTLFFHTLGNNSELKKISLENNLEQNILFDINTTITYFDDNKIERDFNVKIKSGDIISTDFTIAKNGKYISYMRDLNIFIDNCEITEELSNIPIIKELIYIASADTYKPYVEQYIQTSKELEFQEKLKHFINVNKSLLNKNLFTEDVFIY